MSAIAQFTAFTFTAIAALISLTAAIATTQNESITTSSYLLLLISLFIALATGTGIITVLGFYLANILLIGGTLFAYALFKRSAEEEVLVTQLIRMLPAAIRAHFHTPTFQDDLRQQPAGPQGPQPPRRAVQVDREYAYDDSVIFEYEDGTIIDIDRDRVYRMLESLTEEEIEQLQQFWQWQRTTEQPATLNPTQHSTQRYPPQTGPQDEPIVFEDQL